MNIEKTLKNSIFSVSAYVLNLVLQFISRRVFIVFLDIEYLGYQSLFSNVFTFLSVAELGMGGIISFHLYKELVDDNHQEIGKLMHFYKWVYRIVAATVLVLGSACAPFLKYVVKGQTASWNYLYFIYFLQLGSVVSGYFLSYRRTILIANQREYKCVQVDLYTETIVLIAQIVALAAFRNYIVYLTIQLLGKFLANVIIAVGTNRDYPYLKEKYTVTMEDINRRNMISDTKNLLIHRFCFAIYNGTDSIIISAFCGIRTVALYGNYDLLRRGVMEVLLYKLLDPIRSTIGNILYSDRNKEDLWRQFKLFDVFIFLFSTYIAIGFLLFFQPVIQLWMGKSYLLPFSFVVAFSITVYFIADNEIVCKYRAAFGDYAQDRNCMILSAALNISVSLILVRFWGVAGVQFGTLAAFLPISYGRSRFIVRGYFGKSLAKYIVRHMLRAVLAAGEGAVCWFLTKELPVSVSGILLRFVVWALVPLAVNLPIFWRDQSFKDLCGYLAKVFLIMKTKLKGNRERNGGD